MSMSFDTVNHGLLIEKLHFIVVFTGNLRKIDFVVQIISY